MAGKRIHSCVHLRTAALALSFALASTLFADMSGWREYFVSDSAGNDAWDGTAAEWAGGESTVGPKKTIQAAVDLADGNGTIITVAPGVYDEGGKDPGGTYPCSNRVYIAKGNVFLRSSGGKEVTHIVGARDTSPDNWNGLGPKAVRCVAGSGYNTVTVKGFTLRDGAAGYDSVGKKDNSTRGGGAKGVTVVDCVISNCTAHRGAAGHGCRFVRCVITGNANASGAYGDAGDASCYLNCLITRNPGTGLVAYPTMMVNCTVAANPNAQLINGINTSGPYLFGNCVFLNNKDSNLNATNSKGDFRQVVTNCVADGNAVMPDANDATLTNVVSCQYRTSVGFDWRLMADAEAVGHGKGECLRAFELPDCEDGVYRDLNGNVINPNAESIDAGCFQGNYYPTECSGSPIVIKSADVRVDGFGDLGVGDWITAARFPEMFRVKSASEVKAYGFYNNDRSASYDSNFKGYFMHYPDEDGWARYVANTNRAARNLLTKISVRAELYVDPENGDDANDGSAAHPLRTLQAANDAATEHYTLVHAAPGIYAEGGAQTRKVSQEGVEEAAFSNRLCITNQYIGFVADIPRTAVIKGAPDPETNGLGTNAMRCVAFTGPAPSYSYIRGFDLTGGYAYDDATDNAFFYGGAVHCNGRYDVQTVDCVISNNFGYNALFFGGTVKRSKFFDNNVEKNAVLRQARAYDCVWAGNTVGGFIVGYVLDLAGCTADTGTKSIGVGHGGATTAYLNGSVFENCKSVNEGALTEPPLACVLDTDIKAGYFADFANRDYRLSGASPAVNLVTPDDFAAARHWWQHFGLDAYGAEPVFDAQGRFNAGASRAAPLPYVVISVGEAVTVTGATVGTNVLAEMTGTITLDATAEPRPFDGFTVNGELRHTGKILNLNVADLASGDVVVLHYTGVWYANASAEDDSGDGFTPATAKRTLAAAAANAIAGDVVRAAPGVYGEGTAKAKPEHATANRVYVPAGVTLESTGGRDVTVIRGASDTVDPDTQGNGTNAVRCVYLGKDAVLRGFTLTGGRTQYAQIKQNDKDDFGGGAVCGVGIDLSFVEDCVVYGCSAHCGGVGRQATFRGSVISNCTCSSGANARSQISRYCNFHNCVFDHFTKGNPLECCTRVDSCTFGADMAMPAVYQPSGTGPHIVNSVFLGSGRLYNWSQVAVFTNCVFGANVNYTTSDPSYKFVTNGCIRATDDELVFDANYRPVVGANVCVDAALAEFCVSTAKDAFGTPRLMNGARDIGGVEADWRPRYAKDIGPGVAVPAVDGAATEVAGPAVRLPATAEGTALTVTLTKAKAYDLEVVVAEGATLTMTKGDDVVATFTAADGVQSRKYVPAVAGETLVFTVTGESGHADILGCRHVPGMAINFR